MVARREGINGKQGGKRMRKWRKLARTKINVSSHFDERVGFGLTQHVISFGLPRDDAT